MSTNHQYSVVGFLLRKNRTNDWGDSPERGNHEIHGISRRESGDQGQKAASRGNGEAGSL